MENSDKTKQAVALSYDVGDEAPRIVAAGKGAVAERIIEKAKENDVPLYEDSKLAGTLSRLEIGDTIPPELYEVVAEILLFVDDMDKLRGKVLHGK
ncbi:MAG: EscU/YscU/HrcU family type III secretion system export apparatus switch protein [Lachnospiraceae bacterium]|nr:EscU/YscU/HrcU family type III secretion system export apparatus switch protein [Lachnospiraceae bacterium]